MNRGLFAVFKPAGMTSAQVTGIIKRILQSDRGESDPRGRTLKVGHGGTLDKDAEGVLVIGVGEDCKKLQNFLQGEKEYDAIGRLGVATDTLDSSGTVVEEKPWGHVTKVDLLNTLKKFQGEQLQTPPVISALKVRGRRMSDLARMGKTSDIEPKPRAITISKLELVDFSPPAFRIIVACSKGTYIRSLISDIGKSLRTVAHVKYLCRTKQGKQFYLENALSQEEWTVERIAEVSVKGDSVLDI